MSQSYYDIITEMEKKGVDPDYVQGWQGGYLHNPTREEQRMSEAYSTGFEDGKKRTTDSMSAFIKQ